MRQVVDHFHGPADDQQPAGDDRRRDGPWLVVVQAADEDRRAGDDEPVGGDQERPDRLGHVDREHQHQPDRGDDGQQHEQDRGAIVEADGAIVIDVPSDTVDACPPASYAGVPPEASPPWRSSRTLAIVPVASARPTTTRATPAICAGDGVSPSRTIARTTVITGWASRIAEVTIAGSRGSEIEISR